MTPPRFAPIPFLSLSPEGERPEAPAAEGPPPQVAPPPPRHREAPPIHRGPPDRGRDFNRSSRHRGQWNKKNG